MAFLLKANSYGKKSKNTYHSENENSNLALIIGVNKYPNLQKKYQLKGCVNDAKLVENLLTGIFQFESRNIRVLTDNEATRDKIIQTFKDFLIVNARKDAQIVFYFSGHGGQMTDLNEDEQNPFDETILPHDAHRDPKQECKDISDDEIYDLLSRLSEKCDNIIVILDSCHSGSGTRVVGGDIPKKVDEKFLIDSSKFQLNLGQRKRSKGFSPPNDNCVVISACRDDQLAYEIKSWKKWFKPYGSLTLALNKAMRQHPKATYREMMYKVSEKVRSHNRDQLPQLEGKRRDAPVLGNLGIVENFIEIEKVSRTQVKLKGGIAHNVTKGSVYAVYTPGTTNTKQKENYLGTIKITEVDTFSSKAAVLERKGKIVKNGAAFEISHNYGDLQLVVHLDSKVTGTIRNQIRNAISGQDLIKLVSEDENYDLKICLERYSLVLEKSDGFILTNIKADENNIKYKLPEVLEKEARYQNFFALTNINTNLKIKLEMKRWEQLNQDYEPINELKICELEGGHRILHPEDFITVLIKNESEIPLYIYLFDLGTDDSITPLFPPEGGQDSPLAPNDCFSTFPMQVALPEGLDALKVIATSIPTDFSVLTQEGVRDPRRISRALESPLGQLIAQAWRGKRRGNGEATKIEDWATDMISFIIKKKDP